MNWRYFYEALLYHRLTPNMSGFRRREQRPAELTIQRCHLGNGKLQYMRAIVMVDKAGRLILPKGIRKEMHLEAGDTLELQVEGERLVLSPVRGQPGVRRENGIWVYRAGKAADLDIVGLIEQIREDRSNEIVAPAE